MRGDFSDRWRTLARAAARVRADDHDVAPTADRMRDLAARGLARLRPAEEAGFQEWRSLMLAAMLMVASGLGIWLGDVPLISSSRSWMQELADLPKHVPRSPHVPSPATLFANLSSGMSWSETAPTSDVPPPLPPVPETSP
jgi:hypothetical protein